MDVVQWIARRPGDPAVGVCFAPSSAERVVAGVDVPVLRRRGATLASVHLPRPLVAALPFDVVDDDRPTRVGELLLVRIVLLSGGDPIVDGSVDGAADDVRFAAVLGEFVGVAADLCAAAGLPFSAAVPSCGGQALDVVLGAVAGMSRARLGDALVLFAVAVRTAALARGFDVRATLVMPTSTPAEVVVDGRIEEHL
jgi:hypothetical protein